MWYLRVAELSMQCRRIGIGLLSLSLYEVATMHTQKKLKKNMNEKNIRGITTHTATASMDLLMLE